MILTCPECASRYVVDDDRVGPEGRTVRCAACGSSWRAMPTRDPAPVLDLGASDRGRAAEPMRSAARGAAEDLPRAYRERQQAKRQAVRAAAVGVVAAVLGVVLLAGATAAVVFRSDVVAAWPGSAGVFAAVGLPVNATGLVFEDVTAVPDLRDGRALVVVSGGIRNVADRTVTPPPVRVALLDAEGRSLAVKIASPGRAAVPAGELRRFSLEMENPPAAARDVDVSFVLSQPRAAAPPPQRGSRDAVPAAPRLAPRPAPAAPTEAAPTPTPQAAQPLPADSPYALPPPTPAPETAP